MQIQHINDLSEQEHKSVMYRSSWSIPKEEVQKLPKDDYQDIKVSPFIKYDPQVLEMKAKSLDKRSYLIREHQKEKHAEKRYLESLKDPKQFSLKNSAVSYRSKTNRFHKSQNNSIGKQEMLNTSHSQIHTQAENDLCNNLIKSLKKASATVPVPRLEFKRSSDFLKTPRIKLEDEQQSEEENYFNEIINFNQPTEPEEVEQDVSQNNIYSYGQNLNKYPKFYKYLERKNSLALQKRESSCLKIYHDESPSKEAHSHIKGVQSNNTNRSAALFTNQSTEFKKIPLQFEQIQQDLSLNNEEHQATFKYQNISNQTSFNLETKPIEDQEFQSHTNIVIIKPQNQKTQDRYKNYDNEDQETGQEKTKQRISSQKIMRSNTLKKAEQNQQEFLNQFSKKYPYILKKLQSVYKGDIHGKVRVKGFDQSFVSVYDSIEKASQSHQQEIPKAKEQQI